MTCIHRGMLRKFLQARFAAYAREIETMRLSSFPGIATARPLLTTTAILSVALMCLSGSVTAGPQYWPLTHGDGSQAAKPYQYAVHERRGSSPSGEVSDLGIFEGECNREALGALLGGIAGGAVGSRIGKGESKAVATIAGTLIGVLIGRSIGRSMDETESPGFRGPCQCLSVRYPPRDCHGPANP